MKTLPDTVEKYPKNVGRYSMAEKALTLGTKKTDLRPHVAIYKLSNIPSLFFSEQWFSQL